MVMPRSVLEAEAASDEAIAQLDQERQENAASATSLGDIIPDEGAEGSQTEVEEVVNAEQPKDSGEATPAQDYEQKYKTLMGKYNAEVPRLQAQLNEMSARMTQMLTQAPVNGAEDRPVKEPEKDAPVRYLKTEEVEEYGEEILDMQARMARGVAESVIKAQIEPLTNRITYLESKLDSTKASSFWDRVEQQVPGAKQINDSDPLWADFLEGVEPNSGLSYREIGEKAFKSGDVSRLVKLFKLFMGNTGDVSSSTGTETAPARKEGPPVKPAKSSGHSEPKAPAPPPTITESQVTAFYDDKARGRYKGREQEAEAKERAIEKAFEAGRIVAG